MIERLPNEDLLLNPKPGTAAARAREFGIDLTLTVENLRRTPEERIHQLDAHLEFVRKVRAASKFKPSPALQKWRDLYWNDRVLFDAWAANDHELIRKRVEQIKIEAFGNTS